MRTFHPGLGPRATIATSLASHMLADLLDTLARCKSDARVILNGSASRAQKAAIRAALAECGRLSDAAVTSLASADIDALDRGIDNLYTAMNGTNEGAAS